MMNRIYWQMQVGVFVSKRLCLLLAFVFVGFAVLLNLCCLGCTWILFDDLLSVVCKVDVSTWFLPSIVSLTRFVVTERVISTALLFSCANFTLFVAPLCLVTSFAWSW